MRIEHIAMYVNDLESARDFFVTFLGGVSNNGYHNEKTDFRSYFISFTEGARLEIMNKPDLVDEPKPMNRMQMHEAMTKLNGWETTIYDNYPPYVFGFSPDGNSFALADDGGISVLSRIHG